MRRTLVTSPYVLAARLATLKVGELTQILVSRAQAVGSGASGRAAQTVAAVRTVVTGG